MSMIQRARHTRRSIMAGSVGLAGTALLDLTHLTGARAQASGEVVIAATVSNYYVLNPLISGQSIEWMLTNVTEPLLTFDRETLAIRPGLATAWSISEDGTEYTFELKEGVTWHDGTPFTSADVKFTVETALLPETAFKYEATWSRIKEVQTPDDLTVKFILDEPFAALLAAFVTVGIVPLHLLEPHQRALNEAPFNWLPVGTGPYTVSDHTDELVTLSAYPDYHGEKARIEKIHFRDVPAGVSASTMLRTGAVDIAPFEASTMDDLYNSDEFTVFSPPYVTNVLRIHVNHTEPLFEDVRVRQALYHGVDRESAIVAYGQPAIVAHSMVPPGTWAFHEGVRTYPYDPELALSLLAEAGWTQNSNGKLEKDGQPFKFTITLFNSGGVTETAIVAQQGWLGLGMDVDVQTVAEWASWVSNVWESKNYQVSPMAWDQGIDPGVVLPSQLICDANSNVDRYCNPEMDALLNLANSVTDEAERRQVFADIQDLVAEDVASMPVMCRLWRFAVRSNINGIVLPPVPTVLFDMNRWYLD